MKTRIALGALCACSAPPPVAPANHCPAHDDVAKFLAQPVDLDLRVLDDFQAGVSCAGKAPRVVRVSIDRQTWCETSIPCTTAIQAPPRSFACSGKPVAPGMRSVGVEIVGDSASLTLRTMSVPAFERTTDGSLLFGAHVRVWASEHDIIIDPPTPLTTMMM